MKSKNELKTFFENGDIPKQEEFWEWQDSYWHKDEKLPAEAVDLSTKADLVDGKVPASQLPDTNGSDTLSDVMNRGNITSNSIGIGSGANIYYLGVNTNTFNLRMLNKNPVTDTATGKWNMAVGDSALISLTSGARNTAIGGWTGQTLTTGASNVFLGVQAGNQTTTGNSNLILGYAAGYFNTSGSENVFIGAGAGSKLKDGSKNTFVGTSSGVFHGETTNGQWAYNTFLGYISGTSTTSTGSYGNNNVVIGAYAPLGGEANNKLIIHSQTQKSDHSKTIPLINGDFVDRWLSIGGNLKVHPNYVIETSSDSNYESLTTYNSITGNFGKTSLENFKNSVKRPYKVYSALLEFNQTTLESQLRILENTIGDIVWTKIDTGRYHGVLAGGFSRDKTLITTNMNEFTEMSSCTYLDNNTLLLRLANSGGDLIDIGGQCGTVEIRVY